MWKTLLVFSIIALVGGLPLPSAFTFAAGVEASPIDEASRVAIDVEFNEVVTPSLFSVESHVPPPGVTRTPISIVGDADFAAQAASEGWAGSGTGADPYIIMDYNINVDWPGRFGICINDTRSHFIITNCSVWNGWDDDEGAGVFLSNVTNGELVDLFFMRNYHDIELQDSHGISITDCYFGASENWDNVYLMRSNNTVITNNTFSFGDDGVDNNFSNGTLISHNVFAMHDDAIDIDESEDVTVTDNIIYSEDAEDDDGVCVDHSDNVLVANCSFTYSYDGVEFHYSTNGQVINCSFTSCMDGVELIDSNNTRILQSWFYACDDGIWASSSNYTLALGNTFSYNEDGIRGEYRNLRVINCTFIWCKDGVASWYGVGGLITNNSFYTNHRAIELGTQFNDTIVSWNCFDSIVDFNILDDGTNNLIDHNYYSNYTGADANSDGIGDTPHPLVGLAGNQDSHPLFYCPRPPTWDAPLEDHIFFFGNRLFFQAQASGAAPLDLASWAVNDTTNFAITGDAASCTITDTAALAVGTYFVRVVVENIYGVGLSGVFSVTVLPPGIAPMLLFAAGALIIVLIAVPAIFGMRQKWRKKK